MEKDLKILKKILEDLHYTETYINMLLSHIKNEFEKSNLTHITPHFIYSSLAFEEGRQKSKMISESFEEMKEKGTYRNIVDKTMNK